MEHYYLIDYENVGLSGMVGLTALGEGDHVTVFLSGAAHTGTRQLRKDILDSNAQIETFYCSVTGKNAMDFEIAAYTGELLADPGTGRVSIISKDTGFKALDDYRIRKKSKVVLYQGETILEAYMASARGYEKERYERTKKNGIDFSQIMADVKQQKRREEAVKKKIAGLVDDQEARTIINLLQEENTARRYVYIQLLKMLGRSRGLAVYRGIKELGSLNCSDPSSATGKNRTQTP